MNILLLLLILNSIITGTVMLVVTVITISENGIESYSQEELTVLSCALILSYMVGIMFILPAHGLIKSYQKNLDKKHKDLKDEK